MMHLERNEREEGETPLCSSSTSEFQSGSMLLTLREGKVGGAVLAKFECVNSSSRAAAHLIVSTNPKTMNPL